MSDKSETKQPVDGYRDNYNEIVQAPADAALIKVALTATGKAVLDLNESMKHARDARENDWRWAGAADIAIGLAETQLKRARRALRDAVAARID